MADNFSGTFRYQQELLDLTNRTNRIKVMLWAGDLIAARQELREIGRDYGDLIFRSLNVKKDILSRKRRNKPEVERKYQEQSQHKWLHDYVVQRELAKLSSPQGDEQADLFIISPVVSQLKRLDKRISEETSLTEIFDRPHQLKMLTDDIDRVEEQSSLLEQVSEYRFLKFLRNEGVWEIRAYRLNAPSFSPRDFVKNLHDLLNASPEILEEESDVYWPLSLRAFLTDAFLVVTVFDIERIQINLTIRHGANEDVIFQVVFRAIAMSQHDYSEGSS